MYRRDLFVEPKFLVDLHKDVKETRVESLEVKLNVLSVGTKRSLDGQNEYPGLPNVNQAAIEDRDDGTAQL